MDLEGYGKKPSKKELNYRKRCFGMTSLDRIQVAHKLKSIGRLQNIALRIGDDSGSDMDEICGDLMILQELIREEIREIEEMDPRMGDPLPRIERKYRTIDSFEETDVRQLFRFESRDQLHTLCQGFQFPLEMVYGCCGNKFSGEEVLLCGIYRIHCNNTLGDAGWQDTFGMVQSV